MSSNPSSIQTRLILGQINLIIFLPTVIAACSLHEAVREIPLQTIKQPMKIVKKLMDIRRKKMQFQKEKLILIKKSMELCNLLLRSSRFSDGPQKARTKWP